MDAGVCRILGSFPRDRLCCLAPIGSFIPLKYYGWLYEEFAWLKGWVIGVAGVEDWRLALKAFVRLHDFRHRRWE